VIYKKLDIKMKLPAASCGVSKGGISILNPLTLTLSHRGEREPKATLQQATGNYQIKYLERMLKNLFI